jgi:hypothetical protein
MEDLVIIQQLQKKLKAFQQVGDVMISGGIDNMDKYKYLLGQAHAYQYTLQEISNLLNKKEQNDGDGKYDDNTNVVKFEPGSTED